MVPEVARKTVTWLSDRVEALAAEALAIENENPVHNVVRPLRERVASGADRHARNPITYRPSVKTAIWLDRVTEQEGRKVRAVIGEAVEYARMIDRAGLTALDREVTRRTMELFTARTEGRDSAAEQAAADAAIEAYRYAIGRWQPRR